MHTDMMRHRAALAAVHAMVDEAWASEAKEKNKLQARAEKQRKADQAAFQAALASVKPGEKWEDHSFKPENKSLAYDLQRKTDGIANDDQDINEEWFHVVWRRPEDFLRHVLEPGEKAPLYNRLPDGSPDIKPDDITQGNLGDCYLLSALSVLAERNETVTRLFVEDETRPDLGLYTVRFNLNGHNRHVMVSDEFPCRPVKKDDLGGPLFSRTPGNDLWVLLVEKAFAKMFGTYQHIIAGLPGECLTNLTGAPCKYLPRSVGEPLWDHVYRATSEDKRAKSKGWHVVALMSEDPEGKDLQKELGLVQGHAYAGLDARIIGGTKLLQLRNPWGNTEWKGAWGDMDKEHWTEEALQEMADTAGTTVAAVREEMGKDDGSFWMDIDDFCKYFNGVQICRDSPGWKHHSEDLKARHCCRSGQGLSGARGPRVGSGPAQEPLTSLAPAAGARKEDLCVVPHHQRQRGGRLRAVLLPEGPA